jgi:hypothetical protein
MGITEHLFLSLSLFSIVRTSVAEFNAVVVNSLYVSLALFISKQNNLRCRVGNNFSCKSYLLKIFFLFL